MYIAISSNAMVQTQIYDSSCTFLAMSALFTY